MNELSVDDKLKEEDCLLYKPKLNNYGIPICDFCGADALAFHTWVDMGTIKIMDLK